MRRLFRQRMKSMLEMINCLGWCIGSIFILYLVFCICVKWTHIHVLNDKYFMKLTNEVTKYYVNSQCCMIKSGKQRRYGSQCVSVALKQVVRAAAFGATGYENLESRNIWRQHRIVVIATFKFSVNMHVGTQIQCNGTPDNVWYLYTSYHWH